MKRPYKSENPESFCFAVTGTACVLSQEVCTIFLQLSILAVPALLR